MDLEQARYIFAVLTISGFVMLIIEIYIPGGVLGLLGALALIASMILAFPAFEPYGAAVAMAILVAGSAFMFYWLKIAPRTWIGRKLTIDADLANSKGTNPALDQYLGAHGIASCTLRPAGFALIDKHRVDVVTRGEMIEKNATIEVIEIESNRVIVKKI